MPAIIPSVSAQQCNGSVVTGMFQNMGTIRQRMQFDTSDRLIQAKRHFHCCTAIDVASRGRGKTETAFFRADGAEGDRESIHASAKKPGG